MCWRRHGVRRCVVCSTSDIKGEKTGPMSEACLQRPTLVCGARRVAQEAAVQARVCPNGLDALTLHCRGSVVRDAAPLVEHTHHAATTGTPIRLDASPNDTTHYIHLDDAVQRPIRAGASRLLPEPVYDSAAGPRLAMGQLEQTPSRLIPKAEITFATGTVETTAPSSLENQRDRGFPPRSRLARGCGTTLRPPLEPTPPDRPPCGSGRRYRAWCPAGLAPLATMSARG